MNERLLLDNHSKPARDASNILYEKVKKHGANRHLIYIFDDDFRSAAQGWEIFLSRTDEDRKVRGSLDGILISLLGQIINRKKSSRKAKYHWTQQTKFRARREINANSIEKMRNLKMEADAADPATGAMVEIDDESFF